MSRKELLSSPTTLYELSLVLMWAALKVPPPKIPAALSPLRAWSAPGRRGWGTTRPPPPVVGVPFTEMLRRWSELRRKVSLPMKFTDFSSLNRRWSLLAIGS